jgi:hypothetical protein
MFFTKYSLDFAADIILRLRDWLLRPTARVFDDLARVRIDDLQDSLGYEHLLLQTCVEPKFLLPVSVPPGFSSRPSLADERFGSCLLAPSPVCKEPLGVD